MFPRSSPLIWKLAFLVTAINTIVVAVTVAWLAHSRQQYENDALVVADNLAEVLQASFAGVIREVDHAILNAVDEYRKHSASGGVDEQMLNTLLAEQQARLPEIDALRATDANGNVRYGAGIKPGVNLSDREYFVLARKPGSGLVIGKPVLARISQKWVIVLARRLEAMDGSFAGVVYANLAIERLQRQLSTLKLGPAGSASLRDAELGIIAHISEAMPYEKVVGNKVVSEALREFVQAGKDGGTYIARTSHDQVQRAAAFRRLDPYPLYVAVGLGEQDYLAVWRQEVVAGAASVALFLLVTLSSFWLLARDVSGRQRAEEQLRERERDLRAILDNLPSVISYWGKDQRNRFGNQAYEVWFGVDPARMPGMHIREVIGDKRYQSVLPHIEAALRGEPQVFEDVIPSPDGMSTRYALINYVPDVHARDVRGFFVLISDITLVKLTEAELREHRQHLEELVAERTAELEQARDAAEAASRAKSVFLANMSHELRTPMNAILGMAAIAQKRTEDPRLRDPIEKIENASRHLLQVINDILDISKIEAERLVLEQTPFRLGEIVENLISMIGTKVRERSLRLLVNLPPGLAGLSVTGDPLRLRQILLNLTGNALKFTESGSITLRCTIVEDNPNDMLLRWEVADTGIGIAPEDQKRVFTAFEQADGSMTRKYGGTGLGLAISKRLVHLMGGEMGLDSELGKGSTFWFTVRVRKLPATASAGAELAHNDAADRLRAAHAGARVLLVEDEPINREVAIGLLEDVQLMIDIATDGAEALRMAREVPYDLIIMDVQMPNMNGVDAARAVRAGSLNADTPILAMTANAFEEDRQTCFAAGMNDFIAKPVDPDVLYETIMKSLSR